MADEGIVILIHNLLHNGDQASTVLGAGYGRDADTEGVDGVIVGWSKGSSSGLYPGDRGFESLTRVFYGALAWCVTA